MRRRGLWSVCWSGFGKVFLLPCLLGRFSVFADPGEEFDVAVGALDGGGDEALPVEGGLGGDPGLDAVAGALVGGGVANDAAGADVFAGEFELGLDEDEGHEFGDIGGGHVADVEVFAADDAGVIAEFPDELVGSNIVGVDARGAVLEEAVGEAAGGGTNIKGDEAGDVDLEVV